MRRTGVGHISCSGSHPRGTLPYTDPTAMSYESAIIARVETYVRHPVFEGSAEVLQDVLDDLEGKANLQQISGTTLERLRALILRSPHFRDN